MLYFPVDFGELTIDGLSDTSALTRALSELDLRKFELLASQTFLKEGPPSDFKIMVANGHLETPSATVELQFKVKDILFKNRFIVITSPTSPSIPLLFVQTNSTISDMRLGVLNFPFSHATQACRQLVLEH